MDSVEYKHLDPKFGPKLGQIEALATKMLRFIPRSIPEFPSHGVDHSIQIIEHVDSFIDAWNLELSKEEIFLLYLGAWLHDIGNIVNRENHHEISARFIRENEFIENLIGLATKLQLGHLVEAHSSKYEIKNLKRELGKVKLRFISSIFRIIDSCEISDTKCPLEVYKLIEEKLPPDNKKYWIAHMAIFSVVFKKPEIQFYVTSKESEFLISHVNREISSVEEVLLEYNLVIPQAKMILDNSPY